MVVETSLTVVNHMNAELKFLMKQNWDFKQANRIKDNDIAKLCRKIFSQE